MAAVEGILVIVIVIVVVVIVIVIVVVVVRVVVVVVVSAKGKLLSRGPIRYQIISRTDLLPAHVCAILCGSKTVPLPREKPRPLRSGWALAGVSVEATGLSELAAHSPIPSDLSCAPIFPQTDREPALWQKSWAGW